MRHGSNTLGSVRRRTGWINVRAHTAVDELWALLTDLEQMPGLHQQVRAARWLDGAQGASTGARFATENGNEHLGVWRATCRIVEHRRPRTVAWTIETSSVPPAVCRFDIVQTSAGTSLHQAYFIDLRVGAGPPVEEALAFTPSRESGGDVEARRKQGSR